MRMIAIIGNIASGKSTVSKLLSEQLPDYVYLSIDEFRVRFRSSTKRGEANAWQAIMIAVFKNDNIIFESSGTSLHYDEIVSGFKKRGGKVTVIKLECPIHESMLRRRLQLKNGYVPPPFCYSTNLPTSVSFIHTKLTEIKSDLTYNSMEANATEICIAIVDKIG